MKKILNTIGAIFAFLFSGLSGGQGKIKIFGSGKFLRRYGVPLWGVLSGIFHDGFDWRDLVFLIWIPLLSVGYGEDSFLMGWLGSDWLVRGVYGILMSLPFWFFGWRRGAFAGVLLSIVYSIRAGSAGFIPGFGDILIEDAIRFAALGGLFTWNVIWREE
jgi:hypothetical protein